VSTYLGHPRQQDTNRTKPIWVSFTKVAKARRAVWHQTLAKAFKQYLLWRGFLSPFLSAATLIQIQMIPSKVTKASQSTVPVVALGFTIEIERQK
jgi:hypothetical protein